MLPILKNINIDPLRQHRSQNGATYDNISEKDKKNLVDSLLQEQGYLCAYCMCRIRAPLVKVEHWKCRERFPKLQLKYSNLLAVCCGNGGRNTSSSRCEDERGLAPRLKHCDTRKGNKDLIYNPAAPAHHAKLNIRYLRNGKIESKDDIFSAEMGDEEVGAEGVLNLNLAYIMNNRRAVISRVAQEMKKLPLNAPKALIRPLLAKWKSMNQHGMLPEYAGIAIYLIEKRLKLAPN